MVDDQPFVLGAQATVADFACYHALWFTRRIEPIAGILEATPSILAWMDRIAAFGHGTATKSNATESIAACASNTPAKGLFDLKSDVFQDEHGIALGSRVSITAESFGPEPTEGELVAATRTRYTLRRVDERAGTVHVHFPRVGFVLKALGSA
jgi:Glutathione S-transferase, C-terminal domain